MKPVAHIPLHAAARAYGPLIAMFGAVLAATYPAGSGVGFVAGLVFALLHALHLIADGAQASRAAFPPIAARIALMLGVITCVVAAGAPQLPHASRAGEVGLFLTTGAGFALALSVLVGRAPSLRDEDW